MNTVTTKAHNIGIASQIGKYSDAVEVPAGHRLLFLSGTPGLTPEGTLAETFEGQAEQAWRNVLRALESARMGVEHLVKITQYLVRPEDVRAYQPIRAKMLGDSRPASMLMMVAALPRPDLLFEIEACAAAPVVAQK